MDGFFGYNTKNQEMLLPIFPLSDLQAPNVFSAKPFVKWVGGKSQLIPELICRLPKNFKQTVSTYIEPFIGGGAFLFWLLSHDYKFKRILINDANKALINTYKVIRDNPEGLISILSDVKMQYLSLEDEEAKKSFYYDRRKQFNTDTLSEIEYAALMIFLNKTCFNGLYRVNAKGSFNVPHGRYANPLICDSEIIRADSRALKNVEISNADFSFVLQYADERSFVYFDPPYRPLSKTSSFCSYCEGGFDDQEQRRLARYCRELNDCGVRWLLSNSDPKGLCPEDVFFDVLYEGFNIQSVQASRMLNANPEKRGKLNELLISNY